MKASKELKIGVFVIVVLTASFFVINFLRGKDIFDREMDIVSYYEDVCGLLPSAPVYIKGYKAGSVSDVVYDSGTGLFEVECSVLKQFSIPDNSIMTIYSVDIMGGKGIRIDLGASGNPIKDGEELAGSIEPDLIASLSGGIGVLFDKVSATMDTLTVSLENVNRIIEAIDENTVASTVSHLGKTISNLEELSSSINGKSDELVAFIENLTNVASKLDGTMDKVDGTMSNVESVSAALSESDVEGLISSLNSLVEKLQDPDGSIGKLVTDGGVYDSLDSLLSDIDELVNNISKNPKKYIKISIF